MDFGITETKALKNFKDKIGKINHYLITVFVGLEGVYSGAIKQTSSFKTSWNPQDPKISALLSRDFVIKATVAYLVDSIDSYFIEINRAPTPLRENLKKKLDKAGEKRSVYERINAVASVFTLDEVNHVMVEFLVNWRNLTVHSLAEVDHPETLIELKEKLLINEEIIFKRHRNLTIKKTISRFEECEKGNKTGPTFKEISSFIEASKNFIYEIDNNIVNSIDFKQYCIRILKKHVEPNKEKFTRNIFSKIEEKKITKIKQVLLQNRIFYINKEGEAKVTKAFSETEILDIYKWGTSKAKEELTKNTEETAETES